MCAVALPETIQQGLPETSITKRPDVAKQFNSPDFLMSGWGFPIDMTRIPPGAKSIGAWAYDSLLGKLYRLRGARPIPPMPATTQTQNTQ